MFSEKNTAAIFENCNQECLLIHSFRSFGSVCVSLTFVARGTLDGYQINELFAWDIAAGTLLIREAGGYVCKPDGSPIDLNDPKLICGATEKLCKQLIQANNEALNLQ